jgi:hypothetical protein
VKTKKHKQIEIGSIITASNNVSWIAYVTKIRDSFVYAVLFSSGETKCFYIPDTILLSDIQQ